VAGGVVKTFKTPEAREEGMKETRLTLPQLSLIAGTRALLGAGMAMLLVDRLTERQRKRAGWAMFLAGAVSTIPLARMVLEKRCDRMRR
jgi:hypothetical protein